MWEAGGTVQRLLTSLTYDLEHDLPVARGRPLEVHPAAVRAAVALRHAEQREHRRRLGLGVQLRAVRVPLDGGRSAAAAADLGRGPDLSVGVGDVAAQVEAVEGLPQAVLVPENEVHLRRASGNGWR